jgi:hypothetical protein
VKEADDLTGEWRHSLIIVRRGPRAGRDARQSADMASVAKRIVRSLELRVVRDQVFDEGAQNCDRCVEAASNLLDATLTALTRFSEPDALSETQIRAGFATSLRCLQFALQSTVVSKRRNQRDGRQVLDEERRRDSKQSLAIRSFC